MRSGKLRLWAVAGCVGVMAAAGLLAGTAGAAILPPGAAILAPPAPGTGGGTVIAVSGPVGFNAGTFAGVMSTQVLLSDPANPFGPGFLTFTYQFNNLAISPSSIDRMTIDGFDLPGLLVDASFQPGPGQAPTSFDRSGRFDVWQPGGGEFHAGAAGIRGGVAGSGFGAGGAAYEFAGISSVGCVVHRRVGGAECVYVCAERGAGTGDDGGSGRRGCRVADAAEAVGGKRIPEKKESRRK